MERRGRVVARDDATGQARPVREAYVDQPVVVAPPVARVGERPVDTGRPHLERVGLLPHHLGVVEHLRHLPRGIGDVVQADAAVAVDGDPEHAAPAGRGEVHILQVEAHRGERLDEQGSQAVPGLSCGHGIGLLL